MQNSSEFQYLTIDTVHESATNPRRTFDESKLIELAESIRTNGLIQPITVRPNANGFEIVAGARRFRAAQLAELFSLPARIVDINDAQALEWQLVENSQRVDVHPYEEAQGFQRLLDMPGYDVATLVEKSGKSAAHVYARLSLLQLVPTIAEAFLAERITASHANLLARLPQEHQANAYEQCWRKDWQDKEPHLAPAKHLAAWIQANLYLSLAEAPFDKEDTTLNPPAGACVTCPRRSGFNTSLFADVQGDQCLDAPCFHTKVNAHIDREVAAHPELIQIENGYRAPKEQRPGAVRNGTFREVEIDNSNPDAEPVMPCEAAKSAIIVYGKRIGTTLTVCTENNCPVHDPRAAARAAEHPAPVMAPAPEAETEEQAEERRQQYEAQQKAHQQEEERRAEEHRQQQEREEKEREAEFAKRDKLRKKREATFERIVQEAPPVFTAPQLRVILRALVNLDPYTFADDLAEDMADENEQRSAEEVLLALIEGTADDKLTSFAVRLALAGHRAVPRENELDFLAEAEAAFLTPKPKKSLAKKEAVAKKEAPAKKKVPTPIKPAKAATKKKPTAEKETPQPAENAVAA
jgi:ParB family chromosome partitioning protein